MTEIERLRALFRSTPQPWPRPRDPDDWEHPADHWEGGDQ